MKDRNNRISNLLYEMSRRDNTIKNTGSNKNEECRKLLSVNLQKASNMLKEMKKQGILIRKGS